MLLLAVLAGKGANAGAEWMSGKATYAQVPSEPVLIIGEKAPSLPPLDHPLTSQTLD